MLIGSIPLVRRFASTKLWSGTLGNVAQYPRGAHRSRPKTVRQWPSRYAMQRWALRRGGAQGHNHCAQCIAGQQVPLVVPGAVGPYPPEEDDGHHRPWPRVHTGPLLAEERSTTSVRREGCSGTGPGAPLSRQVALLSRPKTKISPCRCSGAALEGA